MTNWIAGRARTLAREAKAGDLRNTSARWRFAIRRALLGPLIARRDPVLADRGGRLRELERQYAGERCFVMGNGPSLNSTPLELLDGERVWGLNRCFYLFERTAWRPTFYVAVDQLGIRESASTLKQLMADLTDCTFFLPGDFRRARVFDRSPANVCWIDSRWFDPTSTQQTPDLDAALLPDLGVIHSFTVTVVALQLAIFLGFNPIYLIGCDAKFVIPDRAKRLATGEAAGAALYQLDRDAQDPNHFDPRYHQGSRFFAPNMDKHIATFEIGRKFAEANDTTVLDATVGGQLRVFPKVEFESLFR